MICMSVLKCNLIMLLIMTNGTPPVSIYCILLSARVLLASFLFYSPLGFQMSDDAMGEEDTNSQRDACCSGLRS